MLLILVLIAILTYSVISLWRATKRLPKGPTPLPLIGNIHTVVYYAWKAGGIVAGLREIQQIYGNVFTIWMGPIPTVHITDFEVAHETHVKRANTFGVRYSNGGTNYIREGRGIIASNGEFWQEHRIFALKTLRNFGVGRSIMEERIMEEYNYRFQDYKKTNLKNGGIEVHASSCFDLLVGSIINTLLVSERFEQDNKEFEKLQLSLAQSPEQFSILDALTPLAVLKSEWWKWRTEKLLEPLNVIFGLVQKGIKKRVDAIASGNHIISEEGDDFVDAFLIKMEKDKKDGVKDSTFTLETLAIDLYDLWLAGQDTTSTTLTWACACLLNHPEVVEELRRELVDVTGGIRGVSLIDKPNTPYLNATINEIQRIASVLNINIFRQLEEDTVIDGQPVSAGAIVTTQLSLLHTNEAIFKNHTVFNPSRFLENKNLEKTFIPFGIGKRACLGEALARAELYLIIGNLALDFNFEPVGTKPEIKTTSPFTPIKRPPNYQIRFIPVNN